MTGRVEGSLQDVTERHRCASALHDSQANAREAMARVRAVLDAVPDLWFVLSEDGRCMEVSRPDHPGLAVPWDQARGRHIGDVVPARVGARAAAALARAQASGGVERIEYRIDTVSGAERACEARIVTMADGRWRPGAETNETSRRGAWNAAETGRGDSEGLPTRSPTCANLTCLSSFAAKLSPKT